MPFAMVIIQKNARAKETRLNENEFIMRASKTFCVLMFIFTATWAVLIIVLNLIDNITVWVNLILWICELFLILVCIQCIRQKIVVKLDRISYTPIFGKTKMITLSEINKVVKHYYSGGLVKYKIYVNKKIFCCFAESAVGAILLINNLRKAHIPIVDNK